MSNTKQTGNQVFDNILTGLEKTTTNDTTEQPKNLVVDDNEQVRSLLKTVLEVSQFRVEQALGFGSDV